ncbi:unnamed protein product [Rhodiola kirilowii]
MTIEMMMHSSKPWWLNAHNSPKRSTCLQSTIKELDEKTMSVLKIIEEDADSLAQRADMYYTKRPQLISMVQDLYSSHRSLAEKLYAAKLESRILSHKTQIESSPTPCFKSKLDRCGSTVSFVDTYTDSLNSDLYSSESEVDDPDEAEVVDHMVANQEMVKLSEEIERLRIENQIQQAELVQKDEEKREAIRQLSLAVDMMKEENLILRKSLAAASTDQVSATSKKWSIPEFRKVFFFGI